MNCKICSLRRKKARYKMVLVWLVNVSPCVVLKGRGKSWYIKKERKPLKNKTKIK